MRKRYVDYIKGIAIILVVLGHINSCNGFAKAWIYAFHMPLFFVATGITTKKREQVSGKILCNYFCKKVKNILVPYFLWGLIYAGGDLGRNLLCLAYGSYSRICSIGSLSSLWFLPTMFVAVCAMEIVKILDYKFRLGQCGYLLIMALCMIGSLVMTEAYAEYPFSLNVAVMALAYIIFGYLLEQIANASLEKWNRKQVVLLAAISFLGTMTYRWNPIVYDGCVLMANMRIGEPVAFVATSLIGCIMVYTVARLLDDMGSPNAVLSFFGQNSLVIFAVHKPLIEICTKLFGGFSLPDGIELLITGTATLLVSSFLCVLINRFAPDLTGKSSQAGT